MTSLAHLIGRTRDSAAPLAFPIIAFAAGDPAQARREAIGVLAATLRDNASLVLANDAFLATGTALIFLLLIAPRLAHALHV